VVDGFLRLAIFICTAVILAESVFSAFPKATICKDCNSPADWPLHGLNLFNIATPKYKWKNATEELDYIFAREKNVTKTYKDADGNPIPADFKLEEGDLTFERAISDWNVEDFGDIFDKHNADFILLLATWAVGLWLMTECVIVPERILGTGTPREDRLIHLTRQDPLTLTSIFAVIVSTARVKDVSALFSVFAEDVEFLQTILVALKSFLLAVGLAGLILAFNRAPLKKKRKRDWPSERWYDRDGDALVEYQTNPIFFIPFWLSLSICPLLSLSHDGITFFRDFPQDRSAGEGFSDTLQYVLEIQRFSSTRIVSVLMAVILGYDAFSKWLIGVERPVIHLWTVLGHIYLCMTLSAADNWDEIFDTLNNDLSYLSPFVFCVPAMLSYGVFNLQHIEDIPLTVVKDLRKVFDLGVYYRIFYTLAIIIGIAPGVLLFFGINGPWIELETEPGPVVVSLKEGADTVVSVMDDMANAFLDLGSSLNWCLDGHDHPENPFETDQTCGFDGKPVLSDSLLTDCAAVNATLSGDESGKLAWCENYENYDQAESATDPAWCTASASDNVKAGVCGPEPAFGANDSEYNQCLGNLGEADYMRGVGGRVSRDTALNSALEADIGDMGRFSSDPVLSGEEDFDLAEFGTDSIYLKHRAFIRDLTAGEKACMGTTCNVFIGVYIAAKALILMPTFTGFENTLLDIAGWAMENAGRGAMYSGKYAAKVATRGFRMLKKSRLFKKACKRLEMMYDSFKDLKKRHMKGEPTRMFYAFTGSMATTFISVFLGFWRREKAYAPMPLKFKYVIATLLVANFVITPILIFLPASLQMVLTLIPEALVLIQARVTFAWKCIVLSSLFSFVSAACWMAAIILETGDRIVDAVLGGIGAKISATDTKFYSDTFVSWITASVWLLPVLGVIIRTFIQRDNVLSIVMETDERGEGNAKFMIRELEANMGEMGTDLYNTVDEMGGACDLIMKLTIATLKLGYRMIRLAGGLGFIPLEGLVRLIKPALNALRVDIANFHLFSVPKFDMPLPKVNDMLLALLFACPTLVVIVTGVGFAMSIVPSPNTKPLHVFRRNLAWTGLCVSLTFLGIANLISKLEVPIFKIRMEVSSIVMTSVLCNVLGIFSYFSSMVDSEIPILAEGNALAGQKYRKVSQEDISLKMPSLSKQ
jgi:hypothetical protein